MGLVYDSALPRICPRCKKPQGKCRCAAQIAAATRPVGDGVVRVRREVRNGKPVTVGWACRCAPTSCKRSRAR